MARAKVIRWYPTLGGVALPSDAVSLERALAIMGAGVTSAARHEPFRSFVSRVYPRFRWYAHCELIARELQAVADGETKRLMVFAPPRHGKTLLTTLFGAYMLRRFPDRWLGQSAYGDELATKNSRAVRGFFRDSGGRVAREVHGVHNWEVEGGIGGAWAAGVRGPITGKGMHLGVLDDPTKGAKTAESLTTQEEQCDWWQSTWYTRLEPDAALVLIMTRWVLGDLGGWLLEQETAEDEQPEHWRVLHLEAIREPEEAVAHYPDTCTVVRDDRRIGEALCSERYPIERLRKIEQRLGFWWPALYQQRPAKREHRHQIFVTLDRWPNLYSDDEAGPDATPAWLVKAKAARAAWEHCGGWDFGSGDSLLVCLFGLIEWTANPRDFHLWVDDELTWRTTAWRQAAADVSAKLERYGGPRLHYGDPAGTAADSAQTSWEVNLQSGGVPLWCLPASANTSDSQEWAIREIQALLSDGRIHVHRRCLVLREAMREWRRNVPTYVDLGLVSRVYIPPRKDIHSHPCQALIYMFSGVLMRLKSRLAKTNGSVAKPEPGRPDEFRGPGAHARWSAMLDELRMGG